MGKLRDDVPLRIQVAAAIDEYDAAPVGTWHDASDRAITRILDAVDRHLANRTAPPAVPGEPSKGEMHDKLAEADAGWQEAEIQLAMAESELSLLRHGDLSGVTPLIETGPAEVSPGGVLNNAPAVGSKPALPGEPPLETCKRCDVAFEPRPCDRCPDHLKFYAAKSALVRAADPTVAEPGTAVPARPAHLREPQGEKT